LIVDQWFLDNFLLGGDGGIAASSGNFPQRNNYRLSPIAFELKVPLGWAFSTFSGLFTLSPRTRQGAVSSLNDTRLTNENSLSGRALSVG